MLKKSGIFLLALLLPVISEASFAQKKTDAAIDTAILPWLGTWTAIDETPAQTKAVLEIRPDADGIGLDIKTKDAEQPVGEIIIPDGVSRPVESGACTGTRKYQWEKQTGIILGESKLVCQGEAAYNVFTLKMMTSADGMADILVIKTPDQTRLAVRRFAFEKDLPSAGEFSSRQESMVLRTALAAPWDIDKIINLSKTIETVVLEAALLEKNLQVKLDTKSLRKMKSTGTPDSIIDLLVAMSAPDKFKIEKNDRIAVEAASSPRPRNGEAYQYPYRIDMPYYGYYYPWNYYWSYYSPFWWGYPIYLYPNYIVDGGGGGNGGSGGGGGAGGASSGYSEGRLSSGNGYVQVTPRDTGHQAVPRGSATPGVGYTSAPGGGYTAAPGSVGSSAGYSAGSAAAPSGGGSSSAGASASPSGYSGGGSSGTAVPR